MSGTNRTRRSNSRAGGDGGAAAEGAKEQAAPRTGVVRDGFVLDFISGTKEVKETAKERVRQRVARALFHEYGISVDDMASDFPVRLGGRLRRADIVVFGAGKGHKIENVQRIVDGADHVVRDATDKYPSLQKLYVDGGYSGTCAVHIKQEHRIDVEVVRHPANRNVGRWANPDQRELFPVLANSDGFVVLPNGG